MQDRQVKSRRGGRGPLHDVGKIGAPDTILLKPARLTVDEFEQIKRHVSIGAEILAGGTSSLLQTAERIALTHHERWDGTGYPAGTRGEEIPLAGRIVAVADVFDALTTRRPYKEAWPTAQAVDEIVHGAGTQFDPAVIEVFKALDPNALVAPPAEPPPAARFFDGTRSVENIAPIDFGHRRGLKSLSRRADNGLDVHGGG